AEGERRAAGGDAVDAALMRLAKLGTDGLQHDLLVVPYFLARDLFRKPVSAFRDHALGRVAARTARVAFGKLLVLRHRIVLEHLALEDPNLDAAGAVGGESRGDAVIDIGAQRMQRNAALAIPLGAGDFRAAKTACAVDANAFGAKAHCRLHGAFHGAAECDAALKLLRDRLGDQLRVELGLADFDDIDDDIAVGHLRHDLAELFDIRALLADHHARTRRVNGDAALLVRALDNDFRHRRLLEQFHQLCANLDVFKQKRAIFVFARIPARIPGTVDADPKPDWIDFLTHRLLLRLSLLLAPRSH